MARALKDIFVVSAKRTPFCKHGGYLRELPASHAFAAAAKDALSSANVNSALVDTTIVGNANYLSQCDGGKTPRYCGIYSGVPIEKPALGVNKACGSGLQAVVSSAVEILTGSAKICLTGGTEIMSALPFLVRNLRFGTALGGRYLMEDHIKNQFLDSHCGMTLEEIAEDIANRYSIRRDAADKFAFDSYIRWKTAQKNNVFNEELSVLKVTLKKKEITVDLDQLNEYETIEQIATAPPTIEGGTIVTPLNSSGAADGAAALVIADAESVQKHKLTPLSRVVGWALVGLDPRDTGLGAAAAVGKLLKTLGTTAESIDLFEINETFASQTLATIETLKLDRNKVNVNGGALALGNPIAATGARMAVHLVHLMRRKHAKTGIAASSCGGGQGIAVMFENL